MPTTTARPVPIDAVMAVVGANPVGRDPKQMANAAARVNVFRCGVATVIIASVPTMRVDPVRKDRCRMVAAATTVNLVSRSRRCVNIAGVSLFWAFCF